MLIAIDSSLIGIPVLSFITSGVGAFIGSLWTVKPIEILFLSIASGSILYIIGELLHLGRKMKDETVAAAGLLVGFFLAFATELIIGISSGGVGKS